MIKFHERKKLNENFHFKNSSSKGKWKKQIFEEKQYQIFIKEAEKEENFMDHKISKKKAGGMNRNINDL